ncbi:SIMPL domain-containing protein [Granulicella mallensis]|uniref:Outer membrane protein n=1 Tax=Granulicella mallensis (strain ATCC BAA-1857 / DSM 23137 / MP5ACTX8) TaxID=682795 RepID=G8NNL2_GRAMM|nr:SIMPL domain-containing protein [Granulicella mallensis]AEU34797.1 protein of unknown function DUF541 [Granulicella mallensis MP5ACTX8]
MNAPQKHRKPFAVLCGSCLLVTCLATQGCSSGTQAHTLSTHAMAHRRLSNTVADVSVGIETNGASMAEVARVLATRSQSLMAYLKREGADRLTTGQISIEPKLDNSRGSEGRADRIVGYTGTMSVSFRSPADKVSDLMSGALAQGANTLGAVVFTSREEDVDAARKELAVEATHLAMEQAASVAKAAGSHIAGIIAIEVDPQNATLDFAKASYAAPAAPAMAGLRAAPIATAAGDQDLSIAVNVQVEVAQ